MSKQEALRYYNLTTKLRELLEFAQNYLQTDDEVNPIVSFNCTVAESSNLKTSQL